MTNEEKILAKLDELTEAVAEARRAVRPMSDLKKDMEPVMRQLVDEAISKLGGVNVDAEDVGRLVGATLGSAGNLAEGVKTLNALLDLKQDMVPVTKQAFNEIIHGLDSVGHGFDSDALFLLLRQTVLNLGNLAEGLKTLNAVMEFKEDASDISKMAMDMAIDQLESLKQKGVFEGLANLATVGEKLAGAAKDLDFSQVKPITGVFGMLGALKDPKVQKGLGVAIYMAGLLGAVAED
ncbi:MAG: DUF1641 domain-containing protein [bacterium]|nr:DUF1641 domain-containing protein [bacterium]